MYEDNFVLIIILQELMRSIRDRRIERYDDKWTDRVIEMSLLVLVTRFDWHALIVIPTCESDIP